jgi:hypothetical protein
MEFEIKRCSLSGRKYKTILDVVKFAEKYCIKKLGGIFLAPRFDFSGVRFCCGNKGIENIAKLVFAMTKYCSDDCLVYVANKSMEYKESLSVEYIFSKFIRNWIVINARDEVAKKLGVEYFGKEYKESHLLGSQKYYHGKIVLWEAYISYREFHEVFYYGVVDEDVDEDFRIEYGEIDHNKLRPMKFRNDRVYYPPHEMNGFFDRNRLNEEEI